MSTGQRVPIPPVLWVWALALLAFSPPGRGAEWPSVNPDELAMREEPKAPRAPAIVLYRQVDRDDNGPSESVYERIKVLTEEGRRYADVEIRYSERTESIRGIEARTLRPDGTIATFDGTVYERPVMKARGVRLMAKTFTLPDVQVGSIVEYRYRRIMSYGYVWDSKWVLSGALFTKHARFTLLPYRYFTLTWSWPVGLPAGTANPLMEKGKISLEPHDVEAFVTEEYMPPEDALQYRVEFVYDAEDSAEKDPAKFWARYGKARFRRVEKFVDQRRAMERAVAQTVQPGDLPIVKLRKLYARAQQIRNLSYERERTDEEARRENIKHNDDVDDVWTRGYGDGEEITWLFLALVRAAGLTADAIEVSTRDRYFFRVAMMNAAQLNTNVVRVRLDGQELFFDPGTAFTPFGFLPWSETGVKGLCLDKDGGSWITTPTPDATESRVERRASLKLSEDGVLGGRLTVNYTGLEAVRRRLDERLEDDTARKRFLEEQVADWIPVGSDVTLVRQPDWTSSSPSLQAEFDLRVPGWAVEAGSRWLLPAAVFGGAESQAFRHVSRVYALYFAFPHQQDDDVTITLPPELQITSLPAARDADGKLVTYKLDAENAAGALHLRRQLTMIPVVLPVQYYDSWRAFFQDVRTGDEQQVVLTQPKRAAGR